MKVKCPTCSKPAEYAPENAFRPFCSERCKLIDLGEWASGNYAIPSQTPPEPEELEAALEEAALKAMSGGGDLTDDPSVDKDKLH